MKNIQSIKLLRRFDFDLFKLDSETERSPNSWLWCSFNPNSLKIAYKQRLKTETQSHLAKRISLKLNCGKSTIEKHLTNFNRSKDKCTLPIKLLRGLLNELNPDFVGVVNHSIDAVFSVNNLSQKIKVAKRLSSELAEVIGSFVADGYFHKSKNDYYLKVSEGNKKSLVILKDKFRTIFGFEARLLYSSPDNMWNLWIKNKVICRYFENIFGFNPGKKAETVCMPSLIQNSDIDLRKAFARGVFTFDGCVKTNGIIAFCTRSKKLMEDIKNVLDEDNIQYTCGFNKNKNAWNLESTSGRDKELLRKWEDYFFPETIKHQRLRFFLGDYKTNNLTELEEIFPIHHHNIASLREIYQAINHLKKGEINDLVLELNRKGYNLAKTTFYKYLYILTTSKLINKENYFIKTSRNGFVRTVYSVNLVNR